LEQEKPGGVPTAKIILYIAALEQGEPVPIRNQRDVLRNLEYSTVGGMGEAGISAIVPAIANATPMPQAD